MQRTEFWDWSQRHVVSGYRTLGTCTERRQTLQDSHVGLATGVAERLSFVEMPQLLALQLRGHTFGGQLADASDDMSFLDLGSVGGRAKSTHS